jgi:hypothetical protein
MAQPKLAWTEVDSSNVRAVAYDEPTKLMVVRFHNGGLYSYEDVGMDVYVDLVHAESVGKYLNQMVKGIYPYAKWNNEEEVIRELTARRP